VPQLCLVHDIEVIKSAIEVEVTIMRYHGDVRMQTIGTVLFLSTSFRQSTGGHSVAVLDFFPKFKSGPGVAATL
jgi:hypothetical protein